MKKRLSLFIAVASIVVAGTVFFSRRNQKRNGNDDIPIEQFGIG